MEEFANARVFFGHQSVGNNIIHGLDLLYAGRDDVTRPVVRSASDLGDESRFVAHAMVGVNGDPQSKINEFSSMLASGMANRADVVILKFCYVDITSTSDIDGVFRAYTSAMEDLARQYPHLRIVYTTVPLSTEASWKSKLKGVATRTTPPYTADNIARERYNSKIREAYGPTGRLFDIARVEATQSDGTQLAGVHAGHPYFALNDKLASDSGHLNDAGSVLAAEEFVRIIADSAAE